MKKLTLLGIIVLAALWQSCAPVYKCGDPKALKIQGSKRLKAVVAERDSLCDLLNASQTENSRLTGEIKLLQQRNNTLNAQLSEMTAKNTDLISKNNELQKRFESLVNESLTQTDRLNRMLQAKSDELNQKEQILAERERVLQEMQQAITDREKKMMELQNIIARQDSITRRLNEVLRNALLGFNADELSVEVKNGKVYVSLSDRLLFRSGSAAVETKGKEALKLVAGILDKNPDIEILIEGHTDNVPIRTAVFKDNWDLSVARATSIVRILTDDYKIQPTRITASGRGEYFPRDTNATPEGRARNRRTEIILSPRLDELMELLNTK